MKTLEALLHIYAFTRTHTCTVLTYLTHVRTRLDVLLHTNTHNTNTHTDV